MHQTSDLKHFINQKHLIKLKDKRRGPGLVLNKHIKRSTNSFREKDISIGIFESGTTGSFLTGVNELVVKIMKENNVEVTHVSAQTFPNAEEHHTGEFDRTLEDAMGNIEAFEQYDFDYILNLIGGDGLTFKEYDKLFVPGTNWYNRAKEFTGKVKDVSEIMALIDFNFKYEINRTAVYAPAEDSKKIQELFQDPLGVIHQIPGLYHIEDMEIENIKQSEANLIITSHPQYHAQMKSDNELEVKHLLEVVAEACGVSRG